MSICNRKWVKESRWYLVKHLFDLFFKMSLHNWQFGRFAFFLELNSRPSAIQRNMFLKAFCKEFFRRFRFFENYVTAATSSNYRLSKKRLVHSTTQNVFTLHIHSYGSFSNKPNFLYVSCANWGKVKKIVKFVI